MLHKGVGSGGFRFISILVLAFCQSLAAAVFGGDTRTRILEGSPGALRARSTAIAVLSSNYSMQGNQIKLEVESMDGILCSDEKFAADPYLSYACTGFLVAPDLLVTAGHCMVNTGESRNESHSYCEAFAWLFDYNSGVDFANIPREKLFGCKEIVYAIREERAPFRDYAVVRLDRPVLDREPLKLAPGGETGHGLLSMIGYPFGTPAKLATNARVLLNAPLAQSFITNLDAFDGNSGSPVFNGEGEVVGILTGGTPIMSLVHDSVRDCHRYNQCHEDGTECTRPDTPEDLKGVPEFQATGSIVQRIAPVIPWLSPQTPAFAGL